MAQVYPLIRSPATLTPTTLNYGLYRKHRVLIRHPACLPYEDLLFSLYAWDHPNGGIYHAVVHNACAIIADNRLDGYLTATRNGPRLSIGMDEILSPGSYYFHVPNGLTFQAMRLRKINVDFFFFLLLQLQHLRTMIQTALRTLFLMSLLNGQLCHPFRIGNSPRFYLQDGFRLPVPIWQEE